ncbi:C40 family peptidase [Flavobacterium rhizosphaerae]|uniref:NlpC/P60 family protein n=1 Tax=Flavobacterium rhizosphaerae TaxID=3163298 RepID=A0ABW8YV83_9FLAO
MIKKLSIYLFLFVAASWSAGAQITTSKSEAEKKGAYSYNDTRLIGLNALPEPRQANSNDVALATAANKPAKEKPKKSSAKKTEQAEKATTAPNRTKWQDILSDEADYEPIPDENYLALQIVNNALDFEGVRYRTGGTTTDGMDCSGMVYTTFQIFDITLPRSSHDQAGEGRKINLSEVRKGDLLFFKNNRRHNRINHVGLVTEVTEDGEIKFIHAALHGGVIISSMSETYYTNTFAQANRIIED